MSDENTQNPEIAPEENSNEKRVLIIFVIILALAALIGGGIWFATSGQTPQSASQSSLQTTQTQAASNEVKQSGNEDAATSISDKANHAQSKPGSDVSASANSSSVQSKPSNGGASGSSRPSGGGGASGSVGSSETDHVHNWVERTTEKWVIDQQPWWEKIPIGSMFHCKCGESFTSASAVGAHLEENALAGDLDHSYWVETIYDEIHHDAEGHYETVVVGYVCSVCGMKG